jgi:hypothetical protein
MSIPLVINTYSQTQPEYSSFSPVSTGNEVDAKTGNFKYSLQAIFIPGPAGGYTLNLGYNAGINPAQPGSWIGLGWNLNAGSINRKVNVYPDDFCNVSFSNTDEWKTNYTHTHRVYGIPYETKGSKILNVGIDIGKAFLGGTNNSGMLVNGAPAQYKPFQTSVDFYDEFPEPYHGIIDMTINKMFINDIGFGNNEESSMPWNNAESDYTATETGQSIKEGEITYTQDGTHIYKQPYTEYKTKFRVEWNRLDAGKLVGCLYGRKADENGQLTFGEVTQQKDFDCYHLTSEPDKMVSVFQANPSIPAYDDYTFTAQGISGIIEPTVLENNTLFKRDINNIEKKGERNGLFLKKIYHIKNKIYHLSRLNKINFRVKGVFSNKYGVGNKNDVAFFDEHFNSYDKGVNGLGYKQSSNITTPGFLGYESSDMHLAQPTHVEWFSNKEINNGTAKNNGFIDYPRAFNKPEGYGLNNNIGGFSITAPNGVTYHYALPVYNFDYKITYLNKDDITNKREYKNKYPYATDWLLTSITGPDFVDVNNNGYADTHDHGYWVNFMYGCWKPNFPLRSPHSGENIDINGHSYHSTSLKQLYYLDAVYTKTHCALFLKSTRLDGKSAVLNLTNTEASNLKAGSFSSPQSRLKLNKIILLRNSDLANMLSISTNSANYPVSIVNTFSRKGSIYSYRNSGWGALTDMQDYKNLINNNPDIKQKIIKGVDFIYDYSLCPGNPNSSSNASINPYSGKLTLKSIEYKSKGDANVIPPYFFEYELENHQQIKGDIIFGNRWAQHLNEVLYHINISNQEDIQCGDLVSFEYNGAEYCMALIHRYDPPIDDMFVAKYLGKSIHIPKSTVIAYTTTKNPPYDKDCFDIWGDYKCDYINYINPEQNDDYDYADNLELTRITTPASSKAIDAWSLRQIQTPMGAKIKINYEADKYESTLLKNKPILNIKKKIGVQNTSQDPITYKYLFTPRNANQIVYLKFHEKNFRNILKQIFVQGNKIRITSAFAYIKSNQTIADCSMGYKTSDLEVVSACDNFVAVYAGDHFSGRGYCSSDIVRINHLASYISGINIEYGGGLRTKSIILDDQNGNEYETKYSYENGSVTYEPFSYSALYYDENSFKHPVYRAKMKAIEEIFRSSYKNYNNDHKYYSQFLPVSGVLYKKITKSTVSNSKKGTTEEEYFYYTPEDLNPYFTNAILEISNPDHKTLNSGDEIKYYRIQDVTGLLGALTSYKMKNKLGHVQYEKEIQYTQPSNNQGLFEQVHHEHKQIINANNDNILNNFGITTVLSEQPFTVDKIIENKNGRQFITNYKTFDFIN